MKKIITLLICFWLLISIFRTFYNISKLFTEESSWIFLSDEQKRIKLFGDPFIFIKFVEMNTSSKDSILFLSPGGKVNYLVRYYLYPRKFTAFNNPENLDKLIKKGKYSVLLVYQTNDVSLNKEHSEFWKISGLKKITGYKNSSDYWYKVSLYRL